MHGAKIKKLQLGDKYKVIYLSTLPYFLNYFLKIGLFVSRRIKRIYSRHKVSNVCFR